MHPTQLVSTTGPTATLDEIDILTALDQRPSRSPDYEGENQSLAALATELAENPRHMLQRLVELAVELCRADTAGISLLEGDVFRWEALAGVFAEARHSTMPRDASPCGVVIDRDAIQLMHLPDTCFPALCAEPRFVEVLLLPFHDHGNPIGTVWIVSHTPERTFEREDARIIGVLTKYASAAWQLYKQNEVLAEQDRRKNEFLATLSHELRNPFGAITTAAAILQASVPAGDPARRSVDVIVRQSEHIKRLIDDLSDVERIDHGKLTLDRQPVDLRAIVRESVESLRQQIERRRQQLKLELGPAPVVINADGIRLAQIVTNLVDNAAKYTPDNGHISIVLSSNDGEAVLSVQDDGQGIALDRLQSIFEPFRQLDSRGGSAGLGLGLAIVQRLAELHGGVVHVTSDGPGQGSQFTLRLPLL